MLFERALPVGGNILAESRSKVELPWTLRFPLNFLVSLMKYLETDSEGSSRTVLLKV